MDLSEIRDLCLQLPGVTEDIKWEDHLCFNIGAKMFLITSPEAHPINASFKVNVEDFEKLSTADGFKPAPYLARYKWIHITDIAKMNSKNWDYYIRQSYQLVFEKLPKKLQAEILKS